MPRNQEYKWYVWSCGSLKGRHWKKNRHQTCCRSLLCIYHDNSISGVEGSVVTSHGNRTSSCSSRYSSVNSSSVCFSVGLTILSWAVSIKCRQGRREGERQRNYFCNYMFLAKAFSVLFVMTLLVKRLGLLWYIVMIEKANCPSSTWKLPRQ